MYYNYILFIATIGTVSALHLGNLEPKHVVHEKRALTPTSWNQLFPLAGDTVIPVRIGMVQSNLDKGHEMLLEVSNPTSPRYGQYFAAQELHDLFAPSETRQLAVRKWLEENGFASERVGLSVNKQWLQIDATVREMEKLLKTTYYVWEHISGKQNVACDHYHIPDHVQEHIDYITPGIKLHVLEDSTASSKLQKRSHSVKALANIPPFNMSDCIRFMYPQCYLALYNITEGKYAHKGNELGIYASFSDPYVQADSDNFFENVYPRIPKGTAAKVLSVDGGVFPLTARDNEGETNLDTQTAWPIIYPQSMTVWEVNDKYYTTEAPRSDTNARGWFNTWLDAIDGSYCNFSAYGETGNSRKYDPIYPDPHKGGYKHSYQCGVYKPTNVISVSYGGAEAYLPVNYEKRQCAEYMKLGLQGISVFYCSQDAGVAGGVGAGKGDCYPGTDGKVFAPIFPATCPYVTSVGATRFRSTKDKNPPKFTASDQFAAHFSGGGFSNVWETPEYQKKAINTYLSKYPPAHKSYATKDAKNVGANGGVFNRNGRGVPDVVAVGYAITAFGPNINQIQEGSGTSYATPLWAAIITRINEERIQAGKKTVGFINPVLYANPQAMDDITKGKNTGCPFGATGFNATPGWDAASGLGSPRYLDLLDVFMKLP